ncbi:MAG TPA: GNAT family protein [Nocardioides sp.]|nr:GNAT family protein [Nocardioides sp.]
MTFERLSWPTRTARLAIRPCEPADLRAVYAVRSLPEVAEWMPSHPASYEDFLLRQGASKAMDRCLVMELDGTVIGDLYLHVEDAWAQAEVSSEAKNAQAEIGWCLSPAHQGNGFVTEATAELVRICFDDLGVRRVTAQAFADNRPSLRVMERLGMTCEGRFRSESLHRDHGWVDGVVYALLKDDWNR